MQRRAFLLMSSAAALAACAAPVQEPTLAPDGKPRSRVYRISAGDKGRIQFRMLDAVNALRQTAGLEAVRLNSRLNAAAATHARDMSVQNRPWHFGSDGSSPIDRVQRVGYTGRLIGENLSETYETELETLAAWMEQPSTRAVILDPAARELGLAWYQEENGKIWWSMVLGSPELTPTPGQVVTAPPAETGTRF
ncbi:CAP domain-containing protein [Cognatishimia sp. F0-27]|uniref:CAP domain-containing protein n=1 Tax=Cognatishimia sp. F0-27 TaxID=2816855 RepID=UPI001D0C9263|nr:CAP domain-containing protein [Cognatishimia sp. F0-27]MCC1493079.1 CAP domain-containing protein [Cognatishimia sp. F0-27]